MKIIWVLVWMLCLGLGVSQAQADTSYKLGSKTVHINVTVKAGWLIYFAPHDDENTATAAVRDIMKTRGGKLVELSYGGSRNIDFTLGGKSCSVDPNRIFTSKGITNTLGSKCAHAKSAVKGLADAILGQLRGKTVVAVHNNSGGGYSINSYRKGDANTADVYVNPAQDPDDFLLVTKRDMFNNAKANGFNVVLQSRAPTDDGSFSVYAAKIGKPYLNVEAQNGHGAQQKKMLDALY